MSSSGFSGIFITTFEDDGPRVIFNSTPLSLDQVLNLGIQALTALQHGTEDSLYGPFPTQDHDLVGLVFKIRLSAKRSEDIRILTHGRPTIIWNLLNKRQLPIVLSRWRVLEQSFTEIVSRVGLGSDSDLSIEKFLMLKDQIEEVFSRILRGELEDAAEEEAKRIMTIQHWVENLPNTNTKVELLIDHEAEMCFLLVDAKTLFHEVKKKESPFEWLHSIQVSIRERYKKWYGLKIITDPKQQETIRSLFLKQNESK